METNPVVWFEIYVDDIDRARAFYEAVLETKLEPIEAPTGELQMLGFDMSEERMGASGALVKMEGMSPGGAGTLVYFSCEDCAVEADRVAGAGGSVEQGKMSIGPYGHIALIRDTEGNMVGLHSER